MAKLLDFREAAMSAKPQDAWHDFINLCLSVKDEKMLVLLFDLFFTPEEKTDLASRYQIIKALLKKEKPQRQIAKDLKISIAKITRGSNELKRVDKKILEYLKNKL
jgi:TrpR family transcriptional regulator, trp operon repressor